MEDGAAPSDNLGQVAPLVCRLYEIVDELEGLFLGGPLRPMAIS